MSFVCRYVDEVDGSKTSKQGLVFKFKTGDQFVARLSGTGSSGATVRCSRPLQAKALTRFFSINTYPVTDAFPLFVHIP
jgi:hypothetical protein